MRFTPMAVYPMLLVDIHRKSECSGKSHSIKSGPTTAAARIKAEAERAALLMEKHVLEAQDEQLRKIRGLLEIEAEISASAAKLAVFQAASECLSGSQTPLDGDCSIM